MASTETDLEVARALRDTHTRSSLEPASHKGRTLLAPQRRHRHQPKGGRRHCGRAATRLCLDHFRNFLNSTAYQALCCHAQCRRKRPGYSTAPGTPPCSSKDLNFRSASEDRESESRHDHMSSSTIERKHADTQRHLPNCRYTPKQTTTLHDLIGERCSGQHVSLSTQQHQTPKWYVYDKTLLQSQYKNDSKHCAIGHHTRDTAQGTMHCAPQAR